MDPKYTAFISYRHQSPDQEIAKWLHSALENYHIPASIRAQTGRKTVGRCFRDAEELPLCPSLGDDIERALLGSDWLIAVCSPRYLESLWCMREISFFAEHKGRERILLVLADGRPEQSFPELMCWQEDENGVRSPYQPLAAEARGATMSERIKKLKIEKYRLLAPILGVGFDDLRRRALQRRRRITAAVAASVVLAGAALGSYVALNRAKNERLRLEAEEQQRVAETERRHAAENSIGEYLERAAAETSNQERVAAANTLLDALALSEENEGLRREEILGALRKAMYIEPFAPIAGFTNQNTRLLDIVPSPDGRLAVGIENNNAAALIDLAENALRCTVSVDNGQIGGLCFSPEGSRFLAQCDMGRLVTVWNTADGSEAFRYVSEADERYQIANAFFWDEETVLVQDMEHFYLISADGSKRLLYTLGEQQRGYDPGQNIMTILFERPLSEIYTLYNDDYVGMTALATPDRSRLLVAGLAGENGTLLLDSEGKRVALLELMPGTMSEHYALSDDGSTVACLSNFGFAAGWDGESGELLYFYYPELDEDTVGVTVSDPVFSPDGRYVSYVVNDTLFITDARSGERLVRGAMTAANYTPELAYSSDGEYLFVTDQALYIIDSQGRLFERLDADFSAPYNNAVELGERMLITRGDGTAYVCCLPAASSVRRVERSEVGALCPYVDPHRLPEGCTLTQLQSEHSLTDAFKASTILPQTELAPECWYAPDGSRAALTHADGVIELFDAADGGRVSAMLSQLTQKIGALAMTGDTLAAGDSLGRLLLYDLEKGAVIQVLQSEAAFVDCAFHADGSLLMALRADGAAEVYDVEAAERLFTLRSAEGVTDFGFAEDGSCAVAMTDTAALRGELWTDEEALLAFAAGIAGR